MTCQKCNNQNEGGNFCGNCAEPLKEKCPECGEMELIGRVVCEKKLRVAKKEWERYSMDQHDGKYIMLMFTEIILLFMSILFASHSSEWLLLKEIVFVVGGAMVIALTFILMIIRRPVAEQRFIRLHPDYAEIMEKEKGEKK